MAENQPLFGIASVVVEKLNSKAGGENERELKTRGYRDSRVDVLIKKIRRISDLKSEIIKLTIT